MKMKGLKIPVLFAFLLASSCATAFTIQTPVSRKASTSSTSSLFRKRQTNRSPIHLGAASPALTPNEKNDDSKFGPFTFKCKYGYLNPFAIYYGVISILLGIPWFVALNICQLFYKLSGDKLDKLKRLPTYCSYLWGVVLLRLTRSYPEVEGKEIMDNFFKSGRSGMFVANHNAWMDIPFVGVSLGFRNYKMISKVELTKVPILGRAIKVGGHVMVDRSSRRSQLMTLKSGMQWLKDGVHLITFPEGTRSKTGRLLPFKNGAFKMAHKVGAPVIPLSIVNAREVNPTTWMFPRMPSRGTCKVIVHNPIESEGITEDELANRVREAVISGLPKEQHPLE